MLVFTKTMDSFARDIRRPIPGKMGFSGDSIGSVQWHQAGKRLVTFGDQGTQVWTLAELKRIVEELEIQEIESPVASAFRQGR